MGLGIVTIYRTKCEVWWAFIGMMVEIRGCLYEF